MHYRQLIYVHKFVQTFFKIPIRCRHDEKKNVLSCWLNFVSSDHILIDIVLQSLLKCNNRNFFIFALIIISFLVFFNFHFRLLYEIAIVYISWISIFNGLITITLPELWSVKIMKFLHEIIGFHFWNETRPNENIVGPCYLDCWQLDSQYFKFNISVFLATALLHVPFKRIDFIQCWFSLVSFCNYYQIFVLYAKDKIIKWRKFFHINEQRISSSSICILFFENKIAKWWGKKYNECK